MDVSIADAKNRLTELIRAVEDGSLPGMASPVAQIAPPAIHPPPRPGGGMKDRIIQLFPSWDAPVDLDRFLKGDL